MCEVIDLDMYFEMEGVLFKGRLLQSFWVKISLFKQNNYL